MFRGAFRASKSVLSATFRSSTRLRPRVLGPSFVALGLFCTEFHRRSQIAHNSSSNESIEKAIIVENDAIYLNKQTYMERLLGNKRENYVLVVYGEENDEDTRASIKTAKHIKQSLRSAGMALNVYVVSRPTIENVRKIANRILDFPVFDKESDAK